MEHDDWFVEASEGKWGGHSFDSGSVWDDKFIITTRICQMCGIGHAARSGWFCADGPCRAKAITRHKSRLAFLVAMGLELGEE